MYKFFKKKICLFLYYALYTITFISPSYAIPGENIENIKIWMNKQTFFPLGTAESFESGMAFYKTLTDNRELVFTVVADEKTSIWEEIKIITTDVDDLKECRFFYIKDSIKVPQSNMQDTELCYQNIQTTFWNRSDKLFDVIKIIYENKSNTIISDFKSAKLLKKSELNFRYSYEDNHLHKLKKGPIPISIFEGNKYLYLVSHFSFFITSKNNHKLLDDIKNSLNEDEELKKKLESIEKQKKIDQQRSEPYSL